MRYGATNRFWGAHAARVPAMASRHRELFLSNEIYILKTIAARAPQSAREGACAPRKICI
jgi:hypothetical protein